MIRFWVVQHVNVQNLSVNPVTLIHPKTPYVPKGPTAPPLRSMTVPSKLPQPKPLSSAQVGVKHRKRRS